MLKIKIKINKQSQIRNIKTLLVLTILIGIFCLYFVLASEVNPKIGDYYFEDYKIVLYNNVVIASEKIHWCSWKPDSTNDGFKECHPEVIIWNRKDVPIDIDMIKDNFDFSITRAYKNDKLNIYYSKNYEIYEEEKENETGIYNVSRIRFSNWKELDNLNKEIPPNIIVGLRFEFELPQYESAHFDFTYKPLHWLLDPEIDACGTLSTANAVYTLNQSLPTTTTCLNVIANNITINLNGFTISGDHGSSDYGIKINGYNYTTIKNGIIIDFWHGIYVYGGSHNNNLTNITSNSNVLAGIQLSSSSNNTLTGITTNSSHLGIGLSSSSSNNITIDSIYNCFTSCLSFGNSNNNIISGGLINKSSNDLIYLGYSSNNNFNDIILKNAVRYDVNLQVICYDDPGFYAGSYTCENILDEDSCLEQADEGECYWDGECYDDGGDPQCVNFNSQSTCDGSDQADVCTWNIPTNNVFLNVSYNISKENVAAGSLIRKGYVNYLYANVTYYGTGSVVEGANATLRNSSNSILVSNLTDINGLTTLQFSSPELVTFYVNNGVTKTSYIWLSTTKSPYLTKVTTFDWDNLLVNKANIDNTTTDVKMYYSTYIVVTTQTLDDVYNSINDENTFANASSGTDCHYISNVSIDVTSGGKLIIEGCVLEFAPTGFLGTYRTFLIDNGGSLIMNYSNITAYDTSKYYNFYSLRGSILTLKNSYIDYVGTSAVNYETGLEINSTTLIFDNITMSINKRALTLWAPNLTIQNSKISGSYDDDYGDNVRIASTGARIVNSNISDPASGRSNIVIDANLNVTFLNSSYENSVGFGASAKLINKWYYKAYVNDTAGQNVTGVNVTSYNNLNNYEFNYTTDLTGYAQLGEITEYVQNSTAKYYYSNYTIYASKFGFYTSNHTYNVTKEENNYKDVFTLTWLGNITSCGTLGQANTVYTLQNDISTKDNCFSITANNITIDLNNHSITGAGQCSDPIYDYYWDCVDEGETWSYPDYGIYAINTRNITILNGGIYTFPNDWGAGIYISGGSGNNILTNITTNGAGIYISGGSGNNILTNITTNFSYFGIYIDSNSNNTLTNITANNNRIGVVLISSEVSSSNTLIDITANSNTYLGIGLSGTSNTLTDITANSNGLYGIQVSSSSNNNISDSNLSGNLDNDVYLYETSTNNIFLNVSYSTESVEAGSSLIRKWYYRAYVNDTLGNNVSNANVTAYNVSNSYQFNLTTDSTGYTPMTEIIDYVNTNGVKTYYSPYTIYAINSSYNPGSHSFNASLGNNYKDVFTLTSDTCSCAGLNNNWEINLGDYCILTTNCDIGSGLLSFTGTGNLTISANITIGGFGSSDGVGIIWMTSTGHIILT